MQELRPDMLEHDVDVAAGAGRRSAPRAQPPARARGEAREHTASALALATLATAQLDLTTAGAQRAGQQVEIARETHAISLADQSDP